MTTTRKESGIVQLKNRSSAQQWTRNIFFGAKPARAGDLQKVLWLYALNNSIHNLKLSFVNANFLVELM